MIVNFTSLTSGYVRQPNTFGELLLKQQQIQKRVGEMADEITRRLDFGTIGMIGLGNGSANFLHDLTNNSLLRERALMQVSLAGVSRTADLGNALQGAAKAFQWTVFKADNIVLLDEEKTTGRSLSVVYNFLRSELGLPDKQIWTACLIDRCDCQRPEYEIRPDFCGFRVYGTQTGRLYGYGMDIDHYYGNHPNIWYTVGDSVSTFRAPRRQEKPRVMVIGAAHWDLPLEDWWTQRRAGQ